MTKQPLRRYGKREGAGTAPTELIKTIVSSLAVPTDAERNLRRLSLSPDY